MSRAYTHTAVVLGFFVSSAWAQMGPKIFTPNPGVPGGGFVRGVPPTAQPPFVHWDLRELPDCQLPWVLGLGAVPNLDGAGGANTAADRAAANTAFTFAFATWTGVAPAVIGFVNAAAMAPATSGLALDGHNTLNFGNAARDDVQVVAVGGAVAMGGVVITPGLNLVLETQPQGDDVVAGTNIVDGGNGLSESVANNQGSVVGFLALAGLFFNNQTGVMMEGDIVFSGTVAYRTTYGAGVVPAAGTRDLRDVAIHEIGHIIGIAHPLEADDVQVIRVADDVQVIAPGTGVGAGIIIIRAGIDGLLATTPLVDDVFCSGGGCAAGTTCICEAFAGGNGVADSVANNLAAAAAGAVVVNPGPDGVLATVPQGDDVFCAGGICEPAAGGNGVSNTYRNNSNILVANPASSPIMNPFISRFRPTNHALAPSDVESCNFLYTPDLGDAPDPWGGPFFPVFNEYQSKVHKSGAGRTLNGIVLDAPAKGAAHIFGYFFGDDVQVAAVGTPIAAGGLVVAPGPNGVLESSPQPDDIIGAGGIIDGGNGVAETGAANYPFWFECLGENEPPWGNASTECESRQANADTFDDGVVEPAIWVKGGINRITVTITHSAQPGRYRAANPIQRLYLNGYLDFENNCLFDPLFPPGGDLELWWTGVPGVTVFASASFVPPAVFGANTITLNFDVFMPPDAANEFCTRYRLDYGENVGLLQNINGDLFQAEGAAQFGEVEDYCTEIEVDDFPESMAEVTIITPNGSETVTLTGPTTVHVQLSNLADTDGDGLEEVPAEMVFMELTGNSVLAGPITVHIRPADQSPFLRTVGIIEEQENNTPGVLDIPPFTATGGAVSFFDIYFEIFVGGELLHNEAPKHMETKIREKPPAEGDTYESPDVIPLFDEAGLLTDYSLGIIRHTPRPDTTIVSCCLPDGTCLDGVSETDCRLLRGRVLPPGMVCLGDSNGDGIDDACFVSECGECGPGVHWIDTCPPADPNEPGICKADGADCISDSDCIGVCTDSGITCIDDADCGLGGACIQRCNKISEGQDTFPSGALLGIDVTGDCVADVSLALRGSATIHKFGPHDDSVRFPGLRPIDQHKDVIDTEFVQMTLTGDGVTLLVGAGLGAIPLPPSFGAVAEDLVDPSLADSFFDVVVELSGLGLGTPAYNQTPIRVRADDIQCLPPKRRYIHFSGCTPLYDSPVPVAGQVPIANLVSAVHFPYPDCCLPDGTCESLSKQACEDAGGAAANCLNDSDGDGFDDACVPPVDRCPEPSGQDWCVGLSDGCIPDGTSLQFCLPSSATWISNAVGPPTALTCDCYIEGPGCGPVTFKQVSNTTEFVLECQGICSDGTENCVVHVDGESTGAQSINAGAVGPESIVTCNCPPINTVGACCTPFVSCFRDTQANCETQKGAYQGDGTICLGPVACCLPDGTCEFIDEQCCTARDGTSQGPNSDCGTATCGCTPSSQPVPNSLIPDAGFGGSSRFISFSAGDPGRMQVIRVRFSKAMPTPYEAWGGLAMWVGPPTRYCENSGNAAAPSDIPPTYGCDAAPGLPERTYMASTLQCAPFYRDWHGFCDSDSGPHCVAPPSMVGKGCWTHPDCNSDGAPGFGDGVCSSIYDPHSHMCADGQRDGDACDTDADCAAPIYVFHEGVIPSTGPHNEPAIIPTVYSIQVVDQSCNLPDEISYSPALEVATSKWGDTVENTAGSPFPPPEGIIQITDVLAILQKFQNLATASVSARVDLLGSSNPKYIVDHGIGIDDVLQALFAFQAVKYPPPAITGVPNPRPCGPAVSQGR